MTKAEVELDTIREKQHDEVADFKPEIENGLKNYNKRSRQEFEDS